MIEAGLIEYTDKDHIIDIRDKNQIIKAQYCIGDDALYKYRLMVEHCIEFTFYQDRLFEFVRADYIEWQGAKFWLRNNYEPVAENVYQYKYELKFEATEMLFQDIQYFYLNQGGIEAEWSLMNNAGNFLQIAVDDINRYFKTTKFVIGTIEADNISINIKFNPNTTVFAALKQIADAFDCEWYLSGYTLHLVKKLSFGDEIEFENEVSVLSMDRSEGENTFRYNRILALGSTRNIPANYRVTEEGEAVDAIYQKRLRIPKEKGNMIDVIPDLSPEEAIEGVVIFDDVYPKRIGTIEAIETIPYTDTNEETGVVTKWFAYKFKDSGLLFKEDYLLPGIELKLTFQSGKLNGKTFSLFFHPNGFSKTDNSQCFEIARNEDYGRPLPNDIIKPEPGNKYVLWGFNIALVGDQYVPAGEQELYDTTQKWIEKELRDKSVYECKTAVDFFSKNEYDLEIGQRVKLLLKADPSRNLFTFSNKPTKGGVSANGYVSNTLLDTGELKIDVNIPIGATNSGLSHSMYNSLNHKFIEDDLKDGDDIVISYWMRSDNSSYVPSCYLRPEIGYSPMIGVMGKTYSQFYRVSKYRKNKTNYFNFHLSFSESGTFYLKAIKIEKGTVPTDWSPALTDVKDAVRSSRIMGFEKKLLNKYDATYIVGDNAVASRWADVEDSIKTLEIGGQLFEKSESGNVYLLKTVDNTPPSEHNAYSAKASDHRYLNRRTGGTVDGHTYFREGIKVQGEAISESFGNSTFTAGVFGSGYRTWVDKQSGVSYAEFDYILARRGFDVVKLNIAEIDTIGGQILLSLANMFVIKVEEALDSYVCYFENDNGKIPNKFALDDQVICRSFEGGNIKYYWTRVVGIGADYIRISKADKDGNVVPAYGDNIIQFGNRTNLNRQHAILLSAYGSDAPSIKQYSGINFYDLTGKEKTVISPKGNKFTGTFIIEASGKDIVSFVDDSIDGIQIGGVNLLNNSYVPTAIIYGGTKLTYSREAVEEWGVTDAMRLVTSGGDNVLKCYFQIMVVPKNKTVTASGYFKNNGINPLIIYSNNGGHTTTLAAGESTRVVFKVVGNGVNSLQFQLRTESVDHNIDVTYCKFQNEEGNKVTTWSASPEDINAAIESKVAYSEYNSKMQVLEKEISAKVGQTDFDSLGNAVNDLESELVVQAGQIISAVTKAEVARKTADSKNTIYQSDTKPDVPSGGFTIGDIWRKESLTDINGTVQSDASKNIFRLEYRWNGSDWVQQGINVSTSYIKQTGDSITSVVNKNDELSSKIEQIPDQIELSVSKIQVGGRNLLADYKGKSNNPSVVMVEDAEKGSVMSIPPSTAAYWYNKYLHSIPSGTEVTFSISCKATTESLDFSQYLNSANSYVNVGTATTKWQVLSLTRVLKSDLKLTDILHLKTNAGGNLLVEYIQLEYGNKATTGQPAPEDVQAGIENASTAANNAQSTANEAKTAANTANNLLSDIANDNKLDPSEKQSTKKEWDVIVGEYQKNLDLASKYGVLSTNYSTYYTNLSNYITPLLSNLSITSNITGTDFRSKFKAYYDARTDLLNAITAKAKEIADGKASLDEVKAGITINTDGVTAFGKQFKVDTDLIANAIQTDRLEVGQNAVIESDGTIKAKNAELEGSLTIVWDGDTSKPIQRVSIVDKSSGTEKTKVIISPTNIRSINEIAANQYNKLVVESGEYTDVSAIEDYKIWDGNSFVLQDGVYYDIHIPEIGITTSREFPDFGISSCELHLVNATTGGAIRLGSWDSSIGDVIIRRSFNLTSIPPSTYFLRAYLNASNGGVARITISQDSEYIIKPIYDAIEIGKNGMLGVFTTERWFHFSTDGQYTRMGNYGFRITSAGGIQYSSNMNLTTPTWKTLT